MLQYVDHYSYSCVDIASGKHEKCIYLLPPANKVCEGYVFTRVCHSIPQGRQYPSMHCRWYPSMPCHGGVSRPTPRGEVEGSCQGGISRPTSGGGLQAHTQGGSRPTRRGCVFPSMHWGRPPSWDSYCHGQYASHLNAFHNINC